MKTQPCKLFFVVLAMFAIAACGRDSTHSPDPATHGHGTPKDWKFTLPAGRAEEGRKLFVEAECHKCHEIKGEKFPEIVKEKGDVGPELSQMAGVHPPEYFAESIINPNAVLDHDAKKNGYLGDDGKSKMPEYNDIFTVRQLADIVAYMSSLKGEGGKVHH